MDTFKAGVQYGDWDGTVAADDIMPGSIRDVLEGQTRPGEFLIAVELMVMENHHGKPAHPSIRAYVTSIGVNYDDVQSQLAERDDLPVRVIDVDVSTADFLMMFKRFNVVLTQRGLDLENREFVAE